MLMLLLKLIKEFVKFMTLPCMAQLMMKKSNRFLLQKNTCTLNCFTAYQKLHNKFYSISKISLKNTMSYSYIVLKILFNTAYRKLVLWMYCAVLTSDMHFETLLLPETLQMGPIHHSVQLHWYVLFPVVVHVPLFWQGSLYAQASITEKTGYW